jgi:osmoprotectant transport system permease protein
VTVLAYSRDAWIDWAWVGDHTDDITAALREHIALTFWTMTLGILLSIPLALAAERWRGAYAPILFATGALYTIPALALFGLLIPVTGLSRTTALIPLVSYTLLILVRNFVAGLDGVPPDVREAATGMGYSRLRRLARIDVPLALPAIVAGIRIATVSTIGLVAVAALVGQGGLGLLIRQGLSLDFRTPLVVGAGLSALLALVADVTLVGVQRLLMPWARARSARS